MHEADFGLSSYCLTFILSDFQSRDQIRKENKFVFRNIVRSIVDFYPVYKQIDATISECLIEPMFTSLKELINDDADESDVETAAELIIDHGKMLLKMKPGKCDGFIVALRTHLCEGNFKPATRRLILKAIDLWTYRWDNEIIPFCIKQFYEPSMQLFTNTDALSTSEILSTSEMLSESITERKESIV
ncbi:unnamed protein product [Onchocerca flexuosa]|uniref:MMS19 nucleotide excision repair protein n=1 Tax=Onchocerca flexuosa TaxID=387005 RepID=A0A183H9P0_9BILA|nr:unnamed protein product [Onchocerca flexuosa]